MMPLMPQPVRLFTPGPVAVHPAVLRAAAQQPLSHHHRAFEELLDRTEHRLQKVFQTASPVAILTCSATGGHEAIARMLHSPGSTAVVCSNGRFSRRWASMLERLGVCVRLVESAWGENIALDRLEAALQHSPPPRTVWVVHCETSTGVLIPLEQIAALVRARAPQTLICADVVSSLGIEPFDMDSWQLDVAIASSQKGLGGLPGLALIAIGERARRAFVADPATLYFDVSAALDALRHRTTPYTPAMTLIAALDAALEQIEREGLPARWERYRRDAAYIKTQLRTAGYELFGESTSNAVTVVTVPPSVPDIVELLESRYGFIVARGQEHLRDRVFRIGHCGWYRRSDLVALAGALTELMSTG